MRDLLDEREELKQCRAELAALRRKSLEGMEMVELKTPVRHGEEDLWDIYDATGQKILGVYATDQAAGERIAADVIAALNEAAVLRSRLEEAEKYKQLQSTLAAIRTKCEQAKNGSLRTTIRAIHKLASGGTT